MRSLNCFSCLLLILLTIRDRANERVIRHLAVRERKMSFTVIGCGDFYNQARERVWCPWTQDPSSVDQYTLHAIGNPHAEADYTHLDDLGSFVVATLLEPAKSHNAFLNVVSDTISTTHIARLLCRYSGKKVEVNVLPQERMHQVWNDPAKAPAEHSDSAFPVDFWYLVKGTQGKGEFVRPRSQIHNSLFADVQVTPFEGYFKARFGSAEKL